MHGIRVSQPSIHIGSMMHWVHDKNYAKSSEVTKKMNRIPNSNMCLCVCVFALSCVFVLFVVRYEYQLGVPGMQYDLCFFLF